jgi:hypothetical protein
VNDIIIDRVTELAKSKGESPTTSMKAAGVGKDFFYNLRKHPNPSIVKIEKLAVYFNVTTDYLLGRTHHPHVEKIQADPEKVQKSEAMHKHQHDESFQRLIDEVLKSAFDDETLKVAQRFNDLPTEKRARMIGYLDSLNEQDTQ